MQQTYARLHSIAMQGGELNNHSRAHVHLECGSLMCRFVIGRRSHWHSHCVSGVWCDCLNWWLLGRDVECSGYQYCGHHILARMWTFVHATSMAGAKNGRTLQLVQLMISYHPMFLSRTIGMNMRYVIDLRNAPAIMIANRARL